MHGTKPTMIQKTPNFLMMFYKSDRAKCESRKYTEEPAQVMQPREQTFSPRVYSQVMRSLNLKEITCLLPRKYWNGFPSTNTMAVITQGWQDER